MTQVEAGRQLRGQYQDRMFVLISVPQKHILMLNGFTKTQAVQKARGNGKAVK